MKIKIILGLVALGLLSSCGNNELKNFELANQTDSLSYAIGVKVAGDLVEDGLPALNPEACRDGVKDFNDSTLRYNLDSCYQVFSTVAREISSGKIGLNTTKKDIVQAKTDSLSYSIGAMISENMRRLEMGRLNPLAVQAGVADYRDSSFKIPQDECQTMYQEAAQKAQEILGQKNKVAGEMFIAENKNKPGVQVTESGLQYKVIKEGEGEHPTTSDQVTVHYTGRTVNGEVFDSSVERGEPTTFQVGQVIKGWTEGLQLMGKGAKYQFYIPWELAYGPQQVSALILPYSALVFDVEMIDFGPVPEKAEAPLPGQ